MELASRIIVVNMAGLGRLKLGNSCVFVVGIAWFIDLCVVFGPMFSLSAESMDLLCD